MPSRSLASEVLSAFALSLRSCSLRRDSLRSPLRCERRLVGASCPTQELLPASTLADRRCSSLTFCRVHAPHVRRHLTDCPITAIDASTEVLLEDAGADRGAAYGSCGGDTHHPVGKVDIMTAFFEEVRAGIFSEPAPVLHDEAAMVEIQRFVEFHADNASRTRACSNTCVRLWICQRASPESS